MTAPTRADVDRVIRWIREHGREPTRLSVWLQGSEDRDRAYPLDADLPWHKVRRVSVVAAKPWKVYLGRGEYGTRDRVRVRGKHDHQ